MIKINEDGTVMFSGDADEFKEDYKIFIEECKSREKIGGTEIHHIVPKCMGGSNSKSNLVELEIRDHIIAHILLAKAFPENTKVVYAALCMIDSTNIKKAISEKIFSIAELTEIRENARMSRIGEGNPMFGRKQSEETKQLISKINTGRKFTPEQSKQHSEHMKNRVITDTWKENISKGMINKKHPHKPPTYTPEERQRRAEQARINSKLGKRKVIGPDGTIYESVSDCSRKIGLSLFMVHKFLYKDKNSGYKFL